MTAPGKFPVRLSLLAHIEDALLSPDGFRIAELCRQLDCSDKTIRRALALLRAVGAKPIEAQTEDGWRWRYSVSADLDTLFTDRARAKLLRMYGEGEGE